MIITGELRVLFLLSSKQTWTFPPGNTIRLRSQLSACVCACVSVCVSACMVWVFHTCMLVAKQTQVFGVLQRSQALHSHRFYCDCTGVTHHCMHEKRREQLREFRPQAVKKKKRAYIGGENSLCIIKVSKSATVWSSHDVKPPATETAAAVV